MDHLFLPTGARLTEDDLVPCVASRDYLEVSFQEYALRCGFAHALPKHRQLGFSHYETLHPTVPARLEKFVQTWCFFSLLREVLGDDFRHDDFVVAASRKASGEVQLNEEHSNEMFVCTTKLLDLLEGVFSRVRSPEEAKVYARHVTECFDLAKGIDTAFDRIDQRIALSVGVLLETITYSMLGYEDLKGHVMTTNAVNSAKPLLISRMKARGWCENEADYVLKRASTPSGRFFMSKLQRLYKVQDHSRCAPDHCDALQIDPERYKIRHRERDCKCEIISVDEKRLNEIIESGKLPLLDLGNDEEGEEVSVTLEATDGTPPFVALSHVWADGLGNPYANALRACQILHLRSLLKQLHEAQPRSGEEPHRLLLWLDTFCCPAKDGRGKSLAMGRMRKVYQEATHVLVLDDAIKTQKHGEIHPLEAVIRVFVAPWNRRLWCLQEGALPSKLWFQFDDRQVELAEITEQLRMAIRGSNANLKALALDHGGHYRRLRGFFYGREKQDDRNLSTVMRAIEHRSVSVLSDEPLCLAAMLDLDVETLSNEGDAQVRMAMFWKLACAAGYVTGMIIFMPVPKLQVKGFRWAPTSLIGRPFILPKERISHVGDKGLSLVFPGVKLSTAKDDGYEVKPLLPAEDPLQARDRITGQWYLISLSLSEHTGFDKKPEYKLAYPVAVSLFETVKSGSAALILHSRFSKEQEDFSRNQSLGHSVVVNEIEDSGGCKYASLYSPAFALRYGASSQHFFNEARRIALDIRRHEVTLRYGQEQELYKDVHEAEKNSSYLAATKAVSDMLMSQLQKLLEEESFVDSLIYHFSTLEIGIKAMTAHISDMYFGNYLVMDEWYPDDTVWSVD